MHQVNAALFVYPLPGLLYLQRFRSPAATNPRSKISVPITAIGEKGTLTGGSALAALGVGAGGEVGVYEDAVPTVNPVLATQSHLKKLEVSDVFL